MCQLLENMNIYINGRIPFNTQRVRATSRAFVCEIHYAMRAPPIVCCVLRKAAAAPIRIPCAAIPTPPSEYITRTRRSHGSLLCTFVYMHSTEAVNAELRRETPKE
jgi:hypothetical protein